MNPKYQYFLIAGLVIVLIICGCRGFTGGAGQIKSYSYPFSNEKIVSIVDQFLLDHPDYYNRPTPEVAEVKSWVSEKIYIKIPPENNHFRFRIGGNAEISLISAGKENQKPKIERELWFFEKDRLIKNFEKNFLLQLESYRPQKIQLVTTPFILASNTDKGKVWPRFYIEQDTLISYPLPIEFDSLTIDYFKDLVTVYNKQMDNDIAVVQHHNVFRINNDYSGYVADSIYVTKTYRLIGAPQTLSPIFDEDNWQKFLLKKNKWDRLAAYEKLRQEKVAKKYKPTSVYSPHSKEVWMINNKWLKE